MSIEKLDDLCFYSPQLDSHYDSPEDLVADFDFYNTDLLEVRMMPEPCWVVECDKCNEKIDCDYGDGATHFSSEEDAWNVLQGMDIAFSRESGAVVHIECLTDTQQRQWYEWQAKSSEAKRILDSLLGGMDVSGSA